MKLEKKIAFAALGGTAVGILMWGANGLGLAIPQYVYYAAIVIGGVGAVASAVLWIHIAWVWLRAKGLQLGPAILIAVALVALSGGSIWGMLSWRSPEKIKAAELHKPTIMSIYGNAPEIFKVSSFRGTAPCGGGQIMCGVTLAIDFTANAKFLLFYIPKSIDLDSATNVLSRTFRNGLIVPTQIQAHVTGSSEISNSNDVPFSGRIIIYYEGFLSGEQKAAFTRKFSDAGAKADFQGEEYADRLWEDIKAGRIKPFVEYEMKGGSPQPVGEGSVPLLPLGTVVTHEANTLYQYRIPKADAAH